MMIKTNPPIWILTGARAGDNAQLRVLAEATGLEFVEKNISYNKLYKLPNVLKGQALWTVASGPRHLMQPPWPKIVISSGRRSVPAMRWIQARSQGATRLVHIGRPRAQFNLFDLIITTPQYRLPNRPNIIKLPLPLSRLRGVELEPEADKWRHIVEGLNGPITSLLIGGDTNALELTAASAVRLGRCASAHVKAKGGSLLVTTSPRTSVHAEQALCDVIDVPAHIYRWSEDGGDKNPLLGLLALADDLIVTSDSASMLSDAVIAGKPVSLFDVPLRSGRFTEKWLHKWFDRLEAEESAERQSWFGLRTLRALRDLGLVNPPRRMTDLINPLVEEKLFYRLGDEAKDITSTSMLKARCEDRLAQAVARIHGLCD